MTALLTSPKILGVDAEGWPCAETSLGGQTFRYRLTQCCLAATTGTDDGIVCKGCFEPSGFGAELPVVDPIEPITRKA